MRNYFRTPPSPATTDDEEEYESEEADIELQLPPTPSRAGRSVFVLTFIDRLLRITCLLTGVIFFLSLVQTLCMIRPIMFIDFLSIISLFLRLHGLQATLEKNFTKLQVFYWALLVLFPSHFLHYFGFLAFAKEVLEGDHESFELDEENRKALEQNVQVFKIVTGFILILTYLCSVTLGKLLRVHFDLEDQQLVLVVPAGNSAVGVENPRSGLSEEEIASLPSCRFSSSNEEGEVMCVVCQEQIAGNAECRMLPCKHWFHVECIDAWLERSYLCPICNGNIREAQSKCRNGECVAAG